MAPTGEEDPREWEILLSAEVEVFLDDLYESDPASHQLVNPAILILERNGPAEGRPAGGLHHGVADREHEGAAAAVGGQERGPDPAGLRSVAVGDLAGGRG